MSKIKNFVGNILDSNEAINSINGFVEMGAHMYYGKQGLGDAFNNTFTQETDEFEMNDDKTIKKDKNGNAIKKRKMKMGRLLGSAWATYTVGATAFGAVRGALSDGQGNLDIKGIPFI